TVTVLVLALVTFGAWVFFAPFAVAMVNAVAVLMIACPCALGLATPLAIMGDKTGTVTAGKPRVTRVTVQGKFAENELLLLAASAERYSEHPLGKAIVEAARERALTLEPASEFAAQAGHGVRARVAGHEVVVGRPGATVTI